MTSNLYSDLPASVADEVIDVLAESSQVRIERIVSMGQSSPKGFWYDQEQAEWVVVLKGEAKVLFEGDEEPQHLRAGDHLNIPARRRHRVEWTSPREQTIWLAVFYSPL